MPKNIVSKPRGRKHSPVSDLDSIVGLRTPLSEPYHIWIPVVIHYMRKFVQLYSSVTGIASLAPAQRMPMPPVYSPAPTDYRKDSRNDGKHNR